LIRKHHEPCVLFLEDAFAESHAERLRQAGFVQVERFANHFRDKQRNSTEQSVKDPRIIRLCAKESWLLITTDSNMHLTHAEVIKETEVTILATAHNNAEDMNEWIDALIAAKAKIERHFKKTQRPWCGTFTRQGDVHIKPCNLNAVCRRNRPTEVGVAPIADAAAKLVDPAEVPAVQELNKAKEAS